MTSGRVSPRSRLLLVGLLAACSARQELCPEKNLADESCIAGVFAYLGSLWDAAPKLGRSPDVVVFHAMNWAVRRDARCRGEREPQDAYHASEARPAGDLADEMWQRVRVRPIPVATCARGRELLRRSCDDALATIEVIERSVAASDVTSGLPVEAGHLAAEIGKSCTGVRPDPDAYDRAWLRAEGAHGDHAAMERARADGLRFLRRVLRAVRLFAARTPPP